MKMPFGKHKGKSLFEIETSYLAWAAENMHSLKLGEKRTIEAELQRREEREQREQEPPAPVVLEDDQGISITGHLIDKDDLLPLAVAWLARMKDREAADGTIPVTLAYELLLSSFGLKKFKPKECSPI